MKLDELLDRLDAHAGPIPIGELVKWLEAVDLDPDDVAPYVRFCDEEYQRNLLREGPGYQALILCWKPGQASPIHDHRGSACGVRVVQGTATEIVFEIGDGPMQERETHHLQAGGVCGSYDTDTHIVVNQHETDPLVTLHVYTPPLRNYRRYERETGESDIVSHVPLSTISS